MRYRDGYAVEEATVLHFAVLANDINAVRAILQTKRVRVKKIDP